MRSHLDASKHAAALRTGCPVQGAGMRHRVGVNEHDVAADVGGQQVQQLEAKAGPPDLQTMPHQISHSDSDEVHA